MNTLALTLLWVLAAALGAYFVYRAKKGSMLSSTPPAPAADSAESAEPAESAESAKRWRSPSEGAFDLKNLELHLLVSVALFGALAVLMCLITAMGGFILAVVFAAVGAWVIPKASEKPGWSVVLGAIVCGIVAWVGAVATSENPDVEIAFAMLGLVPIGPFLFLLFGGISAYRGNQHYEGTITALDDKQAEDLTR